MVQDVIHGQVPGGCKIGGVSGDICLRVLSFHLIFPPLAAHFFSTANHYIQKGCGAFLEGIHRRLLLLEKDIHILLIAYRKTVRSDLDRLPSLKDTAAIFGCSVRHLDHILPQCHIRKIHIEEPGSPGRPKSYIRWGDIADNRFVRSAYVLPALKADGRRKYSDEFEKAYLEYFNERKEDLK